MAEYGSNSHKVKNEQEETVKTPEKRAKTVANGILKKTSQNGLQKVIAAFLPEDVTSVKGYIVHDVLIPAGKKLLSDILDAFLYPNGRPGGSKNGTTVSYAGYYNKGSESTRPSSYSSNSNNGIADYTRLAFRTRGEAEAVLDQLYDVLQTYPFVKVSDLYDAAGVTPQYTCENYGWRDLRGSEAVRTVDGSYILRLPKAIVLN